MKKSYLLLLLLSFFYHNSYSQSAVCANAAPFCAGGSALTFPNTVDQPSAESGLDYDCLGSEPNPAWFYMSISTAGQLNFHIHQQNSSGLGLDVDFIAWGPFPQATCGAANLNSSTEVGCSYSAAPDENFSISNAQVGDVYMLLITNFSNDLGQISLTQTNGGQPGAGATNCNIVCPLSITGAAPPCPQTTLTAVYLHASAPTFQWYDGTGTAIPGATGSTYTTTVPGDYSVIANSPGCYSNATVTATVPAPTPPPITQNPVTLTECGPTPVNFDLTQNDETFMGLNPSDYVILGYYTDAANAQLGISPIGNPTAYSGTDGEPIYIGIEDENGGCTTVVSFALEVSDCGPIPPADITVCDDPSNDGTAPFDLASLIPGILGSHNAADFTVTFHLSQADANNGSNAIGPTNPYIGGPNQTIYIRMEDNSDPTLFGTTFFQLIVNPQPATPNPADVTACDSYALPALPAGSTYHTVSGGGGTTLSTGTIIVSTQTIYVYAQSGTIPNCTAEGDFIVTINQTPPAPTPVDVTACDSYVLPVLPAGSTYHAGSAGGALIADGTSITTTQTIFIVAETGTVPNCSSSGSFIVTINQTPPAPTPVDVTACDSYVLPVLPAGSTYHAGSAGGALIADGTSITTTQTIFIVAETGTVPNCSSSGSFIVTINQTPPAPTPVDVTACDSYVLPVLPAGSTYHAGSAGGALIADGTSITTTQTIFIVAETGTVPNCSSSGSFIVTINQTPPAPTPVDVTACDSYVLPVLPAGSTYHAGSAGGALIADGTSITTTQTIFIVAETGTVPNCSSSGSFIVTINQTPPAPTPVDVTACDSYVLPVLPAGSTYHAGSAGGALIADGTSITTTQTIFIVAETGTVPNCSSSGSFIVTINQTPPAPTPVDVTACDSYVLPVLPAGSTYHAGSAGGALIADGTSITTTQTIFIVAETGTVPNCSSSGSFIVTINQTPIADAPANVVACNNYTLPFLNVGNYFSGPNGTGTQYFPNDVITAAHTTLYVYAQTGTTPNCSSENSFDIDIFFSPVINNPTPYNVCDDNNDGISCLFDLSTKNGEITGGVSGLSVTYHETLTDSQTGANPKGPAYCNLDPFTQTLYVRVFDPAAPSCASFTTLELHVNPVPVPNAVISDYELCDVNNPGDGVEVFDLPGKTAEILNGQPGVNVSYYLTQGDAQGNIDAIVTPSAYPNASNPQQIWVRLENAATGCFAVSSFNLVVNPLPSITPPAPMNACGSASGIAQFDLSSNDLAISGGIQGVDVSYYLTLAEAQTHTNAIANPSAYTNATPNTQIIYVRVQNITTGCFDTTTLTLNVTQGPVANTPTPLQVCDPNNDGIASFDLTDSYNDIVGSNPPPAGVLVTFHETQTDAQTGANPKGAVYQNIDPYDQTIYVGVSYAATGCRTIVELQLHVNNTPQATGIAPLEVCDDNTDGIGTFNLTTATPLILGSLDPAQHTVSYYLSQSDAQTGANAITNMLGFHNGTPGGQTIWVAVKDNTTGCFDVISLDLIVNPLPVLPPTPTGAALPYTKCDDNNPGDQHEAFDLTTQIPGILNGQTGMSVTFYETLADAQAGINAITNTTAYVNGPTAAQTLHVRIENTTTGCFVLTTMDLRVEPLPVLIPPVGPIVVCDPDGDGFAIFDLNALIADMVQGAPDIAVTFHETLSDAQTGANPFLTPDQYHNIVAFIQPVYVRAVNTLTGCQSVMMIELNAIASPVVPVLSPDHDLVKCDDDANNQDGKTSFDLTVQDAVILAAQTGAASDYNITYYETQAAAQAGTSPIVQAANYINNLLYGNPQTIWVRISDKNNDCYNIGSFLIKVNTPLALVTPTQLSICDDGPTVAVPTAVFDLTVKNNEITGGVPGYTVAYYLTMADAQGAANAIADPTAYTNIANAQTLFVAVSGPAPSFCRSFTTLTIRVIPLPVPKTDNIPPIKACDDNLPVGTEMFDLTQNENYIRDNDPQLSFTYYATSGDAQGGINAIADPAHFETGTGTIYIRVERTPETNYLGQFCYVIVEQSVIVNPLPGVVAAQDDQCDLGATGMHVFNLPLENNANVLSPGQNPSDFTFTYYPDLANAQAGTNPLLTPTAYTNTINPQDIVVTVTNTATGCKNYATVTLKVLQGASAAGGTTFASCDDYGDMSDGVESIDLSQFDTAVLNGQSPADFTVSYFAADGTTALMSPAELTSGTIYGVVTNNATGCKSTPGAIAITIEPLASPQITNTSNTICVNFGDTQAVPGGELTLVSNLSSDANYTLEWSLGGTVVGTGPSYTVSDSSQVGDYTLTATSTSALGCVSLPSPAFPVLLSGTAQIAAGSTTGYIISDAFSQDQTITILVEGNGEYQYQLDNGPILDNGGVFHDVPPLENGQPHTVRVYDVKGIGDDHCGPLTLSGIFTIDYPHYFTPNGDGIHDTWFISGLDASAKIYIFDRYGKFIKQISPVNSTGWDGTYNGQPLPSTDYWFTVYYSELNAANVNVSKEFKAHFSLKR